MAKTTKYLAFKGLDDYQNSVDEHTGAWKKLHEAAEAFFEEQRRLTDTTLNPPYGSMFAGALGSAMPFAMQRDRETYFITDGTLHDLELGRLPLGVKEGDLK